MTSGYRIECRAVLVWMLGENFEFFSWAIPNEYLRFGEMNLQNDIIIMCPKHCGFAFISQSYLVWRRDEWHAGLGQNNEMPIMKKW